MAEHYLVDGYNVLHTSSVLRPLAMRDFEAARESLIEKLVRFCSAANRAVTVVFDGRNTDGTRRAQGETRGVPGLVIQYAPPQLSADTVIERIVYSARQRLDCVVVSSDRGLRDLCRGMGALTMDADSFIRTVREFQGGVKEEIGRTARAAAKPALLEDRLSGDSVRLLGEMRARLDQKKRGPSS